MNRRTFGIALALAFACSALTGCETLRHDVRSKSDDLPRDEEEPKPGEVRSEAPKGFFKSSRLPGALSDEMDRLPGLDRNLR